MKKFVFMFICFVSTIFSSCGQTQNIILEKEAEKMLKDFYTNYLTVFATEPPGANSQMKLEMLQKQYCTESFFQQIQYLIEKRGSDPFLKAQDSDIRYLSTLSVTKNIQKNEYIVSYIADSIPNEKVNVIIYVRVIKVGGEFKIADVK